MEDECVVLGRTGRMKRQVEGSSNVSFSSGRLVMALLNLLSSLLKIQIEEGIFK